jgi:hypothetical protein
MNRQQRDKQSQFVGITGADSSTATRCLEAASWSVEAAIDYFYSNGMQPSRSASKRPDRSGRLALPAGGGGLILQWRRPGHGDARACGAVSVFTAFTLLLAAACPFVPAGTPFTACF